MTFSDVISVLGLPPLCGIYWGSIAFLRGLLQGIAGNPVITLVGAIVIGVPATFFQALLRHAWNERCRRRRDAAAARAGTGRGSVYDAPSTRRT